MPTIINIIDYLFSIKWFFKQGINVKLKQGVFLLKFFHIADLHFGKSIYKVSLLEDQEYWMKQFVDLAVKEKVDAVVIAGDVYDSISSDGRADILGTAEINTWRDDRRVQIIARHVLKAGTIR